MVQNDTGAKGCEDFDEQSNPMFNAFLAALASASKRS
jgi:hypothetical protein